MIGAVNRTRDMDPSCPICHYPFASMEETLEPGVNGFSGEEYTIWDEMRLKAWTPKLKEIFNDEKRSLMDREGMSLSDADKLAHRRVLPLLRTNIHDMYVGRLAMIKRLRTDPVHRKIMHAKRKLVYYEDYSDEESLKYAIKKRKHLINLSSKTLSDDDDDESGSDLDKGTQTLKIKVI